MILKSMVCTGIMLGIFGSVNTAHGSRSDYCNDDGIVTQSYATFINPVLPKNQQVTPNQTPLSDLNHTLQTLAYFPNKDFEAVKKNGLRPKGDQYPLPTDDAIVHFLNETDRNNQKRKPTLPTNRPVDVILTGGVASTNETILNTMSQLLLTQENIHFGTFYLILDERTQGTWAETENTEIYQSFKNFLTEKNAPLEKIFAKNTLTPFKDGLEKIKETCGTNPYTIVTIPAYAEKTRWIAEAFFESDKEFLGVTHFAKEPWKNQLATLGYLSGPEISYAEDAGREFDEATRRYFLTELNFEARKINELTELLKLSKN